MSILYHQAMLAFI